MVSVQIPSARADHVDIGVDIGVAQRGGGMGDVDKTESQEILQVQSQEGTKTNVSEETSMNKYMLARLSQKTESAKNYTHCSVW